MPFVAAVIIVGWAILGNLGHGTQVVLMPDADGHVGQVEVTTEGGSQLLTGAGQSTIVSDKAKAPSAVKTMDEQAVATLFSDALAAEPLPPAKFIFYFLPDSTELTPESLALVPQAVTEIEQRDSSDIGVYGHSDRVGSEAYNLQLSLRRAQVVRALLESEGVDSDDMETASHGEGNPLIATPDGVGEPRNRRVEVVVR